MKTNQKGFTLIELLVVIAIIGLLSTLAVVSLNNARQKSRDAKRVSDIKQIQTALELYYVDNSAYPFDATNDPLRLGDGTDCSSSACDTISSTNGIAATASGTTYMGIIPGDPSNPSSECTSSSSAPCGYSYDGTTGSSNGVTYEILFYTEGATGDLAAGLHCASPNGIVDGSTCQ